MGQWGRLDWALSQIHDLCVITQPQRVKDTLYLTVGLTEFIPVQVAAIFLEPPARAPVVAIDPLNLAPKGG